MYIFFVLDVQLLRENRARYGSKLQHVWRWLIAKIMAFSLARRWMSKMGGGRWGCGEGSHIAAVFVGIILSVLLVEHGEGIGAECTYLVARWSVEQWTFNGRRGVGILNVHAAELHRQLPCMHALWMFTEDIRVG